MLAQTVNNNSSSHNVSTTKPTLNESWFCCADIVTDLRHSRIDYWLHFDIGVCCCFYLLASHISPCRFISFHRMPPSPLHPPPGLYYDVVGSGYETKIIHIETD